MSGARRVAERGGVPGVRGDPAPGIVRRRGVFGQRDFRLFWTGETVSALGSSVTGVALPLVAVTSLDVSALQVALLSATTWLPWLIIGLPAGVWVDRLPPRTLMLTCDVVCVLLFGSVPAAAAAGVLTVAQLLVVAFGTGTAAVLFQTAYQVYLPTLLHPADLPAGNAALHAAEATAQIGGPGLAGVIAGRVGAVWAVGLDAATFLVSAMCLLAMRATRTARTGRPVQAGRPAPAPAAPSTGPGQPPGRQAKASGPRPPADDADTAGAAPLHRQVVAGLGLVARDRYLRTFAIFGGASNFGLVGYQAILVVFLVRDVGLTPGTVGAVMAAGGIGAVAGAAIAPWLGRRLGTARASIATQAVAGPAALLLPLTHPGAGVAFGAAGTTLIAAGIAAGNVIKGSWRQAYAPPGYLGRVITSMQLTNYGTMPLGALLGGVLADSLGLRPAMWLTTAWLATTWLILLASPVRRHHNLPTSPTDPAAPPAALVDALVPAQRRSATDADPSHATGHDRRRPTRGGSVSR